MKEVTQQELIELKKKLIQNVELEFQKYLKPNAYIIKKEYLSYAENLLKNEGLGYLTILETESNKKFNFVKNSPQYEFFKLKMKVLHVWFEPVYF